MIVITGELEIGSGSEDAFLALAREVVEKTVEEEGCTTYAFARDLNVPGLYRIVEQWESEEALERHMRSEHFRVFGKGLRDLDVKRASVVRHTVEESTALM